MASLCLLHTSTKPKHSALQKKKKGYLNILEFFWNIFWKQLCPDSQRKLQTLFHQTRSNCQVKVSQKVPIPIFALLLKGDIIHYGVLYTVYSIHHTNQIYTLTAVLTPLHWSRLKNELSLHIFSTTAAVYWIELNSLKCKLKLNCSNNLILQWGGCLHSLHCLHYCLHCLRCCLYCCLH